MGGLRDRIGWDIIHTTWYLEVETLISSLVF
jgi:hypothetical protein